MKGSTSKFTDLTFQMNLLSTSTLDHPPTISLSLKQLNRWFISMKDNYVSPLGKPLDTAKHCTERRHWVLTKYGLLICLISPVAFLDQKWYYRINRCRKVKILPSSDISVKTTESPAKSKILSRQFSVKIMIMGIVARPQKHHNFNGRILIRRVSKKYYRWTMTSHTNFFRCSQIKDREWRQLVDTTIRMDENLRHFFHALISLKMMV